MLAYLSWNVQNRILTKSGSLQHQPKRAPHAHIERRYRSSRLSLERRARIVLQRLWTLIGDGHSNEENCLKLALLPIHFRAPDHPDISSETWTRLLEGVHALIELYPSAHATPCRCDRKTLFWYLLFHDYSEYPKLNQRRTHLVTCYISRRQKP